MKKFFTSKGFIVTSLSVLCIAILGICWYVELDKNDPFLPDESPPAASTESQWSEDATLATEESAEREESKTAHSPTTQQPTQPAEEYPKTAEESGDEVVIDFTDTKKKETEASPPPAPEGKTVIADPGPEHEVNPDPEVTAPATEAAPTDSGPAPGSVNGDGAVYDPVFGWVVPGKVEQITMDSDGDINKMVGNMGE